ncbi:MAG: PAS domain S-box protein [Pirellulales bacterium]|nr:PAS domain S-box protein [Pirellulales bacterium]
MIRRFVRLFAWSLAMAGVTPCAGACATSSASTAGQVGVASGHFGFAPLLAHAWGPAHLALIGVIIGGFVLMVFLNRWFARRELNEIRTRLALSRQKERELRQSESWYRGLYECSRDAVMLLDERGFLDCNTATLSLFGCADREEFIACHPSELSTATQPDGRESRESADEKIATAIQEGTCSFEWRHQRVDGTPFMAEVLLSRIEHQDRHVLLALVRDISERKRTEDALRAASRNATEANEAKTTFLANVSHELRTPLHGILSFAAFGMRRTELLGEGELHEYFELIRQSGHSLLALVNDLLDLSKFETGQSDLVPNRVNMNALILRVIDECRSMAARRGIMIRLADGDAELPVWCDENRMTQVVRNLMRNAIKFSNDGGAVHVVVVANPREMTVSITDHGVGIPENELDKVFNKFFRSSKTRNDHGGTGLGLAICREIVEAHGGRIWAEGRPGGGTSLVFQIPVAAQSDSLSPPPIEVPADASSTADPAALF